MHYFSESFISALYLIVQFDPEIYLIAWTSIKISLIATLFASIFGLFLGIITAISRFPGKSFVQQILNTLMAMPTVMIGLIFYGLLSRQGPLGDLGLLYTQTAVIIGETCLILPLIMNMTLIAVQSTDQRLLSTLTLLGAKPYQQIIPIISELRYTLLAAIITGFGRAVGEVGAAMMLGGNIQGLTRTMTTAIALETSKGDFELGLALGLLLLMIAFGMNFVLQIVNSRSLR
ncbi:MAG: ABC transporter permease [Methylococcales bacterium]